MKYKVGNKVRVRENLFLYIKDRCVSTFSPETLKYNGMIVTVSEVKKDQYKIEEDKGFYDWYEDMFEPVEEMSAEELARILALECEAHPGCYKCPIRKLDDRAGCVAVIHYHYKEVIEIAKQWKADHEKKPIETEFAWYVQIIEADTHTLRHEEAVETDIKSMDEQKAEILKKWCDEHDGKYYAISERRCVVKE